ncbi:DUF2600 family protein [Sporosarcina sp. NPDC096371]|uniref:DUF2600 family protein n=1 Tax=Sporosarcina sp. NPDC096371 TaxID=3364530 RepID=UPI00381CE8B1
MNNLGVRSASLNPQEFAALHESMEDALTVEAEQKLYYSYREDQDDGGYSHELMQTCLVSLCYVM